jgi:hypothetical protein
MSVGRAFIENPTDCIDLRVPFKPEVDEAWTVDFRRFDQGRDRWRKVYG